MNLMPSQPYPDVDDIGDRDTSTFGSLRGLDTVEFCHDECVVVERTISVLQDFEVKLPNIVAVHQWLDEMRLSESYVEKYAIILQYPVDLTRSAAYPSHGQKLLFKAQEAWRAVICILPTSFMYAAVLRLTSSGGSQGLP